MCTIRANQRGVIPATILGLAIGLWIGFGGPKPPLPSLGFNTTDCSMFERENKDVFGFFEIKRNETEIKRVIAPVEEPDD